MLFTVGHSTLPEADFLSMLGGRVATVIDARSHPTSRWEWFWKDALEKWLPRSGVGYEWWPSLGGWDKRHEVLAPQFDSKGVDLHCYARGKFPKQRIGKDFPSAADGAQLQLPLIRPKWTNVGLYDYSYFMTLPEFLEGADKLIERGKSEDIAFMCCECQWWRCHRSMIADYLAFRSVDCQHIMPHVRQKNKVKFVDGYKLTSHSSVLGNRLDRYEPDILEQWKANGG